VVIPAFNEEATIGHVLAEVLRLPVPQLDVIVVDDGSTDRTRAVAASAFPADQRLRLLSHQDNRGKGAAIRTAIPHLRGKIVVIQDADLEIDPADLLPMLARFEDPSISVVYGTRWSKHTLRFTWSRLASRVLSSLTNLLFSGSVTDAPTCYKMFRSDLLRSIPLARNGFDFCPEVTANVLLRGYKIHEVPISYRPRSIREGKKIRLADGFRAVRTLLACRISNSRASSANAIRIP
jgi:glycosyltransferase involved in cell wall biosynthesis